VRACRCRSRNSSSNIAVARRFTEAILRQVSTIAVRRSSWLDPVLASFSCARAMTHEFLDPSAAFVVPHRCAIGQRMGSSMPPTPDPGFWISCCGFVPKAGLPYWSYERLYDRFRFRACGGHQCAKRVKGGHCGRVAAVFCAELLHEGPCILCSNCTRNAARRGHLVAPDPSLVLARPYFYDRRRAAG